MQIYLYWKLKNKKCDQKKIYHVYNIEMVKKHISKKNKK